VRLLWNDAEKPSNKGLNLETKAQRGISDKILKTGPRVGHETEGMKLLPHTQGGPVDEILHDYGRRARALRGAPAHFEQLLGRLTHEATQRVAHSELEIMVQTAGSALLRRTIQGYFNQRGAKAPSHARVVEEDGIVRIHRREGNKRNLEPRFGEVVITRRGYGGGV